MSKNLIFSSSTVQAYGGPSQNSLNQHIESKDDLPYISNTAPFLKTHPVKNIDEDIQKMKSELNQSYELFQNAGEAFNSINFDCLKTRIKDLHISVNNNCGMENVNDLQNVFEEHYRSNRLKKLTSEMGKEFDQHPGEFADIPEIGVFFKACNQLQRGLNQLKKQRSNIVDLTERISVVTEKNYNKVKEIQKSLIEKKE